MATARQEERASRASSTPFADSQAFEIGLVQWNWVPGVPPPTLVAVINWSNEPSGRRFYLDRLL